MREEERLLLLIHNLADRPCQPTLDLQAWQQWHHCSTIFGHAQSCQLEQGNLHLSLDSYNYVWLTMQRQELED